MIKKLVCSLFGCSIDKQPIATKYNFNGEDIEYLFLVFEDDAIIVWVDADYDTDWRSIGALSIESEESLHRTKALAAVIEATPNKHHSSEVKICFKRLIGEALVCALKNDTEGAERVIKDARNYINTRNAEVSRLWTLRCNGILGILELVAISSIWLLRSSLDILLTRNGFLAILVLFWGCLGASASLIFRIGKERTSPESGIELHCLEVVSRHFVGGISAALLFTFIRAGFILKGFDSDQLINLFGISILGGCSERIIPVMLSKIEQNHKEEKK